MYFLLEFATVIFYAAMDFYAGFNYYFEHVNVGQQVVKIALNLDNSFGVWCDCYWCECKMSVSTFLINEAD